MAKKELNAKKIVMEIILVLVLIIGIILLLGVFGKNASTLDDIETSVSNASNKITNTKDELNKEIDNVLEDVIALEKVTNNNYSNTKKQITNLKTQTNKTFDDLNNLLNEKTVEIVTSVDNTREIILLNNEELSNEVSKMISTETGIVNANVDALRTDLLNVQTNLQLVNETVGGIVSGYLEEVIKNEVSGAKAEMHTVGYNVLSGVTTASELLSTHISNHFTITNGKINALETNLKKEMHAVGGTILNGVASSNYQVLSGVIGALDTHFTVTNEKIDALSLSTSEINSAVSTLNINLDTAKNEIISKIGENKSLIESETGKILGNLSKVETEVGKISTLLGTMDGKLDQILTNTSTNKYTTNELLEIIADCSTYVPGVEATCVLNALGYTISIN
ncbi:MAG: hypothetical protein E7161_04040 [Firmicutes bacterium]|nr:hypothetical protein [Bacillota bacterium]